MFYSKWSTQPCSTFGGKYNFIILVLKKKFYKPASPPKSHFVGYNFNSLVNQVTSKYKLGLEIQPSDRLNMPNICKGLK